MPWDAMMGTRFRGSLRRAGAAACLAVALGLGACDPPTADEILGPAPQPPFEVTSSSLDRGPPTRNGAIVVRFSRPLDRRSVGQRSVRILHESGRRVRRLRARAFGKELVITPSSAHELPAGARLLLQLSGRPSPRTIRATDGTPLAARVEIPFTVSGDRLVDLEGPRLISSLPEDGATGVPPGSHIELRFSEALGRGAIRSGDAVSLRVNGRTARLRLHASADFSSLTARPLDPLPPGARVEVRVQPWLIDTAGNPFEEVERAVVRFQVEQTSLHEITEDFGSPESADVGYTSADWAEPADPGYLVGTPGRMVLGAEGTIDPSGDLGNERSVRFQVVIPGEHVPRGFASALRMVFHGRRMRRAVRSLVAEAGPFDQDVLDPRIETNRRNALSYARAVGEDLHVVASFDEPRDLDRFGAARGVLEVPFEQPLSLEEGESVLVDVRLRLAPGVRLAASPDLQHRAVVAGEVDAGLMPAAYLLVAGGRPRARSLWYDSGADDPRWRPATIVTPPADETSRVLVEFQSTGRGSDGRPDAASASGWERNLSRVPSRRYVRFRVVFEEPPLGSVPPRIDRIEMPFER